MSVDIKSKIAKKLITSSLSLCKKPLIMFSGGKDSTFMLYLFKELRDEEKIEIPTVLVGDPFPFEECLDFCLKVLEIFNITNYIIMKDLITMEGYQNRYEVTKNVEKCCYLNKVCIINKLVKDYGFDCIFIAIRWDEHPARKNEQYIKIISNPYHLRVHPILHFTWYEILQFYEDNQDLLNPLYLQGYTSIGCKPCTSKTIDRTFSDVSEYIAYIVEKEVKERAGRLQDKEKIMERLRRIGYP